MRIMRINQIINVLSALSIHLDAQQTMHIARTPRKDNQANETIETNFNERGRRSQGLVSIAYNRNNAYNPYNIQFSHSRLI